MKNVKVLWSIIFIFFIVILAMGYKFVAGSVESSEDNRIAVVLTHDERNLILGEMRQFLISVQAISQALTEEDIGKVVGLSAKAGMSAEADTPGSIFRKIPLGMKMLGLDTRKKFDDMSAYAKNNQDIKALRVQLDTILSNCVACHEAYKLSESADH
ncbi:MAG: hypothetical protein JJV99_03435 [Colwellia sp.]|nr:hypothetical protein [Colwellia sp.]